MFLLAFSFTLQPLVTRPYKRLDLYAPHSHTQMSGKPPLSGIISGTVKPSTPHPSQVLLINTTLRDIYKTSVLRVHLHTDFAE